MNADADRYDAWYRHKLWQLLPAVYRFEDARSFEPEEGWATSDATGPLKELVARLGTEVATVRRSIDRAWEDQFIESCDDWVIDYIGALVATNLVSGLDARGRRLDVARTINYRRRKGTVGLLEDLAADITGWNVGVVEFFQRLGRTRHVLDLPIGGPAPADEPAGALQRARRLVGTRTGTQAGGFADLRDPFGAAATETAFGEFAHTVDVRQGDADRGWYGIARLGAFVWRHRSLEVDMATPVADRACPNQFTFDPTGRDIPLYAAGAVTNGASWTSPEPYQLPGPISHGLFVEASEQLHHGGPDTSIGVYEESVGAFVRMATSDFTADVRNAASAAWIDTERGRIIWPDPASAPDMRVRYHHGICSDIGAGTYDRRKGAPTSDPSGGPDPHVALGTGIDNAVQSVGATGRITIDDSMTYNAVRNLNAIVRVEIRAANRERPLVRLPVPTPPSVTPTTWSITGAGDAELVLDGLFLSGGDLVLRGSFERVHLRCCTLDPGCHRHDGGAGSWTNAADGRLLTPTRLRVDAQIHELIIERSITGPILTEGAGRIGDLTITDSIVQAADADAGSASAAISLIDGDVVMDRVTLLGDADLHRLHANECLFAGAVNVDDTQRGCVRYSAWTTGSALPQRYRSVEISPSTAVFASREFGRPDFAQLLSSVPSTIRTGAEHGAEMGAFAREQNAVKERGLLLKYREFLPIGVEPVVIYVT